MTAGAFVRIPVGPVPVTLQTAVCILTGVVLGARWGAAAMGTYLLLGFLGLPVFAQGGGPGYLLSPTAGYLFGFVPAAWIAGQLFRGTVSPGGSLLRTALPLGCIYLCGALFLRLHFFLVQDLVLSWGRIIQIGVLPFVAGDLVTAQLVVLAARKIRARIPLQAAPADSTESR